MSAASGLASYMRRRSGCAPEADSHSSIAASACGHAAGSTRASVTATKAFLDPLRSGSCAAKLRAAAKSLRQMALRQRATRVPIEASASRSGQEVEILFRLAMMAEHVQMGADVVRQPVAERIGGIGDFELRRGLFTVAQPRQEHAIDVVHDRVGGVEGQRDAVLPLDRGLPEAAVASLPVTPLPACGRLWKPDGTKAQVDPIASVPVWRSITRDSAVLAGVAVRVAARAVEVAAEAGCPNPPGLSPSA